VPDLQIGTALYELKGMRSDRSHSNYNGSQMKAGVEKREQGSAQSPSPNQSPISAVRI
jgi:hypothetical protein